MTIKKLESNKLVPRCMALGVVIMLVLAGQGASQADDQDGTPHALRDQVEHILAEYGLAVPSDARAILLDPTFLDSLAASFTTALSGLDAPLDARALLMLAQHALKENPFLADHPDLLEEVDVDVARLLDSLGLMQPMGQCMHDDFDPIPELGLIAGPACLLIFLIAPALIVATIVLSIAAPLAIEGAKIVIYLDDDGNEIGDDWGDYWREVSGQFSLVTDWDSDGLGNIREFRWELYPICIGALPDDPRTQLVDESLLTSDNCTDYDDDGWMDGPEVTYWNNDQNDAVLSEDGVTFLDPDRTLNVDDDTLRNTYDPDSDNDGLDDGDEISVGSYPEFLDSDCDINSVACTPSWDTSYYDTTRVGKPGTGDGINDDEELAYWNTLSGTAWQTKYDSDNIASNLLDPDADGDTLLDGEEILIHDTKPYHVDSDIDGLRDDAEVRVHQTDPNHWDTDRDGMPDAWEVENHMNPLVNDANQDADNDDLSNVREYRYARPSGWNEATQGAWSGGTNPIDPDTEGDGLFDGPEVLTHGTDPFWWDTDSDGLPDAWEAEHNLQPLVNDAGADPDGDSFDYGNDGSIDQTWTNLQEYRYERPSTWDEELTGPWPGGTDPRNPDTDGDVAKDGQEVYFGTDPRLNNNVDPTEAAEGLAEDINDDDLDGLNWTDEASYGTNPNDPDTDGDGLCDGGRGAACGVPGVGGAGAPGEMDYNSYPWSGDTDGDGLSDGAEALIWDPEASGEDSDVDADLLGGVIDPDNDGDDLLDGEEGRTTSPFMNVPDSDGDGVFDGPEIHSYGTNPSNPDSDGDLLTDGEEIIQFETEPLVPDTDGDGLLDGVEVHNHGTNPLQSDTDSDALPDAWEALEGTRPVVADADVDADGDGLSNMAEYEYGSSPILVDTDQDSLPDGWEHRYGFNPRFPSQNSDGDGDGSLNGAEFAAGTDPGDPDSDDDGLTDGAEAVHNTLPTNSDTDADNLLDGEEVYTRGTSPLERDSDRDGLTDFDEVFTSETNPRDADSDNDGLSDYDEVFGFQGKYDPNDPDSDDDGISDGDEVALADPNGDPDGDGLSNSQETGTYNTKPLEADSDCDGIEDGAEVSFWNARYSLSTYKPYLRNADVDGDGIKDGIEVGTVGTPQQVLYRTAPDAVDTDGDGLSDDEEAKNNVRVSCGEGQTRSEFRLPEPVPGPSLQQALRDASALLPGSLYEAPDGVVFGVDGEGVYIQGGYGVRLYPLEVSMDLSELVGPWSAPMAVGTNGKLTDPQLVDSDGDGLTDGDEISYGTNPRLCDTDGDGLGDGLERGKTAYVSPRKGGVCDQRDKDTSSKTSPTNVDTDGDGLLDGPTVEANGKAIQGEDANADGRVNLNGLEGDPLSTDSDGDGLLDEEEFNILGKIQCVMNPDCDGDTLLDGLEVDWNLDSDTDGKLNFVDADADDDGVPDGLEGAFLSSTAYQQDTDGDGLENMVDDDADNDGFLDGIEDKAPFGTLGILDLDPLNPDLDGDGVMDGLDINPVSDLPLLGLDLDKLVVKDIVDCWCPPQWNWKMAEAYVNDLWVTSDRAGANVLAHASLNNLNVPGLSQNNPNIGENIEDFISVAIPIDIPQDASLYVPDIPNRDVKLYVWLTVYDLDINTDDQLDIGGATEFRSGATPTFGGAGKAYVREVSLKQDLYRDWKEITDINGELDGGRKSLDEDDVSISARFIEEAPTRLVTQLIKHSQLL